MKLWLDDIRPAPSGWHHAFTVTEAITCFLLNVIEEISFDHDLGENLETGYDLAKWIEAEVYNGIISMPKWQIHSANPVGVKNIRAAMESAERWSKFSA